MAGQPNAGRAAPPVCRWRTSAETLDLIEALERIEALVNQLAERVQALAPAEQRDNGKKVGT